MIECTGEAIESKSGLSDWHTVVPDYCGLVFVIRALEDSVDTSFPHAFDE